MTTVARLRILDAEDWDPGSVCKHRIARTAALLQRTIWGGVGNAVRCCSFDEGELQEGVGTRVEFIIRGTGELGLLPFKDGISGCYFISQAKSGKWGTAAVQTANCQRRKE